MKYVAIAAVAIVFAWSVGCDDTPGSRPEGPGNGREASLTGASRVPSGAAEAADFQDELLKDGVTFDEYEKALFAYAECAAASGWVFVGPPRLTARNNYDFQFTRQPTGGDTDQRADAERLRCAETYFEKVQRTWALSTMMSEKERQEARDYLGACMRAAGIDVPEHPTSQEWPQYIRVIPGTDPGPRRTFSACQTETGEKFGLLPGEVP